MTASTVISTNELTKTYGGLTALNRVSLEISHGETLALVGPNGAGKSTLFKLCLGLIRPNKGSIEILGTSPSSAEFNGAKCAIGFLPEQAMFQGSLTGLETLRFYAQLKSADPSLNNEILERVQLSEAAPRRVATYSKGMRQRLGLAQALIGEPDILFLDEPMSGLDPAARHNFFKIIDEERSRGAAVLLSSHILTELEARTDRIAILNRGELKAIGSIARLRADLNLQTQIRIHADKQHMGKIAKRFSQRFGPDAFMNGAAVLECAGDDKLSLLRELMKSDLSLTNLEISEPTLEQIYTAHTIAGDE